MLGTSGGKQKKSVDKFGISPEALDWCRLAGAECAHQGRRRHARGARQTARIAVSLEQRSGGRGDRKETLNDRVFPRSIGHLQGCSSTRGKPGSPVHPQGCSSVRAVPDEGRPQGRPEAGDRCRDRRPPAREAGGDQRRVPRPEVARKGGPRKRGPGVLRRGKAKGHSSRRAGSSELEHRAQVGSRQAPTLRGGTIAWSVAPGSTEVQADRLPGVAPRPGYLRSSKSWSARRRSRRRRLVAARKSRRRRSAASSAAKACGHRAGPWQIRRAGSW